MRRRSGSGIGNFSLLMKICRYLKWMALLRVYTCSERLSVKFYKKNAEIWYPGLLQAKK
jgi:hypothetical protein